MNVPVGDSMACLLSLHGYGRRIGMCDICQSPKTDILVLIVGFRYIE